MPFRRFVGVSMDAPVSDVTAFGRNRDRLLRGDAAGTLFAAVPVGPQMRPRLARETGNEDGLAAAEAEQPPLAAR